MDIIVKYEFNSLDADLFEQEEIIDHVKGNFPSSLRIFDKDSDGYWSDEDEPEILISKNTTLITDDLCDGGSCNLDMAHFQQMEGFMFMFNENYRKLKYPFKDKLGKDFGDGAILQFTEHPKYLLKTGKMLVCWDCENGCYGYKYEHSINKEHIISFSSHDELKEDVLNHCEIIGDKKKNPDLLSIFQ